MVIRSGVAIVLFLSIVFSSSLASPEEIHFSERTKSTIFFHEGSEVTFDVEGEGDLSKVLITIEREGKVYASNLTNRKGSAKLNLPLVNFSSPFLVKAKRNGLKDEFTIWILDTPRLYISVKRIYLEGDEIKVKVMDVSTKPVEGAKVKFGSMEAYTNENGTAKFVAPEVDFPTSFNIYACREGYENSNKILVWIADNRTSPYVKAPRWVEEGERFHVISNASKVYFAGSIKEGYNLTFAAPEVNETKVYSLLAYDDEGNLIDIIPIIVLDKHAEELLIHGPVYAFEGDEVKIQVFSLDSLVGKKGIYVEFDGQVKETNENGSVAFVAPTVQGDYKVIEVGIKGDYIANNYSLWIVKAKKESLQILAPSMVYGGEEITLCIKARDGNPVFAKVTFGNESKYTDENGYVTFTAPAVKSSRQVMVKASAPGYLEEYKLICIKPRKKELFIDVNPYVDEGEDFEVRVKDSDGKPVPNADVYFNFRRYRTDIDGRVQLTAPDVLISTNYLIVVTKENFSSASRWITVMDRGYGKKYLELIAPLAVHPWEEFDVRIIDGKGGGIKNASINVRYDSHEEKFLTDESGRARIRSPPVGSSFTIEVTKAGYIKKMATISIFEKNDNFRDIIIEPTSSEVIEGSEFAVKVRDEYGEEIEGARVYVDGIFSGETNEAGLLCCKAPHVAISRPCFVFASKEGYNFGYAWIEVKNSLSSLDAPVIESIDVVEEGREFEVRVKNPSGEPLGGVRVNFFSVSKFTNDKGCVSFTAPAVENDEIFMLTAEYGDFAPAFKLIKVLDVKKNNLTLNIFTVPIIMEGENLLLKVRDNYGYPVENAIVFFGEKEIGYTDDYGEIFIKAPEVERDKYISIHAIKYGYGSASFSLLVKNKGKTLLEEYGPLFLAMCIVLIIAIFAYVYYRQYMV